MDPVLLALIGVGLGLISKYAWNRWLSQSSRITRQEFLTALDTWSKECEIRRAGCVSIRAANKAHFEQMFNDQKGCINEAYDMVDTTDRKRGEMRRALILIMMTQIKICDALKLDCSDVARMLVDMGALT